MRNEYDLLIDVAGESQTLRLTQDEYDGIERLLQWPEDLEAYDRSNAPTILDELNELILP
jgi:hypothetical protein